MRRILTALLGAALLLAGVPAMAAEEAGPELSCPSSILVEKTTGEVLFEENSRQRLEPASVTKIMTLLLVLDAVDRGEVRMEDRVTVSAQAAGMGGSQVYLKEGEQLSLSEMVKCVTVVSANDCAVALAEHLAGSEAAFVTRMNERAAELGMEDTSFQNCTGLPAGGHVTSARDIALMARELIGCHPVIREYSTIWMDSIRDGEFGLTNTNRLIRFYPGATGLKTGSTANAKYCMAATAEREGMELIAVVLRSPTTAQRFEDARKLLDYGFSNYSLEKIQPEDPLPPIPVHLGETAQVQPVPARAGSILVRREEKNALTCRTVLPESVEAPVQAGDPVGELQFFINDQLRQTIPLEAGETVERLNSGDLFFRMLHRLFMTD